MNPDIATQTQELIMAKCSELLSDQWREILEAADATEESKVKFALNIALDLSEKTPAGTVTLAFSVRTKAEAAFKVEDPAQIRLPIGAN